MKRSCLRFACLLLVLSMLFGILPAPVVSAGDPYTYEIRDGEAFITSYNGIAEVVTVPDTLGDAPVAGIGAFAFEEATLRELVLPHSLRAIGDGAFYACASLSKVTFGTGLTHIGEAAFADCVSLGEILLPKSLATMGSEVFSGCNALTSLAVEEGCEAFLSAGNCIIEADTGCLLMGCGASVIPGDGSVKSIAPYAFSCLQSLTALEIPDSVTAIGDGAFENTGLTKLFIPASVVSVGKFILHGTSLTALYCGGNAQPGDWQEKWDAGVEVPPIWSYDNTCPHGDSRKEALDPSCDTDGFEKEVCNLCESVLQLKILPAFGHEEKTETVEPTCAKAGYTRVICTVCGEELSRKVLPATSQHGELRTERVEPTCTKDGYEKQICTVCGRTATTVKLPSPGHTEYTETVLPTCAQGGYTRVTCTVCGVEIVYAELPVSIKHGELRTETLAATCTTAGYEKQICTVCGATVKEKKFAALGHKPETETSFPSCIQGGYTRVTCTTCGEVLSYQEIPPSADHVSPETERVEPTCAQGGYEKTVCTACGEQISYEELPKLEEHTSPVTERVEPTCAQGGYVKTVCTACGTVISHEDLPATGEHSSVKTEAVEATCTTPGYRRETCTFCGKTVLDEVYPATGHRSQRESVSPTCSKTGYVRDFCSVCLVELAKMGMPATGHLYDTEGRCTDCGLPKGEPAESFRTVTEGGEVTILGYLGSSSHVVIPSHIQGAPVVKIGDGAFAGKTFEAVSLPYTLREIGKFAFEDCNNLQELLIPHGVKKIDEGAFMGCTSLKALHFGTGVESVGSAAFAECTSLTSVTLPASLTALGHGAFAYCTSLNALYVEEGNTVYTSLGNCIAEKETKTLLVGCLSTQIPADGSVESIAQSAFEGLKGLTVLYIPEGIRSIGAYAFRGTGLTVLTIPASVERVGRYILFDTPVQEIYCALENLPASWHTNWIAGCEGEVILKAETCLHEEKLLLSETAPLCGAEGERLYVCKTCGIPTEQVKIPALGHVFSKGVCKTCGCPEGLVLERQNGIYVLAGYTGKADTLVIPETVDGIPVVAVADGAFAGNKSLKIVFLPASLVFLGEGVFEGCDGLKEILCSRESAPVLWDSAWAWGAKAAVSWGQEIPTQTTVLYGDVNLDGRITAMDYMLLKNHVLGRKLLTSEQKPGGDINKDGKISSADYLFLKNHVLGRYTIKQDQ